MMRTRVVKIGGKYMEARGLRLYAVDYQCSETCKKFTVTIKDHEKENWIAFMFNIEEDSNTYHVVQANENSLELVPLNQLDEVDGMTSVWFVKCDPGSGNEYSVRSAVSPNRYIHLEKTRGTLFILSEGKDGSAKLQDEAA